MSDSESTDLSEPTQLIIARWTDRFFAWLIDYIIVAVAAFTIYLVIFSVTFDQVISGDFENSRSFEYGTISIVFFLYWLILESKTGQSIGKRALHLKITNLAGEKADIKSIAISSFGKAFLLPIDVIVGRLFTNENRQRIFNRLGKTIVIKVEEKDKPPENISYKKD
ncbi:MAG: RDD family protein [Nitrosopumilaceae archaeon]